jgi:hypothetical protein
MLAVIQSRMSSCSQLTCQTHNLSPRRELGVIFSVNAVFSGVNCPARAKASMKKPRCGLPAQKKGKNYLQVFPASV